MHIMSAGSLPAMYGGVSIAISYAKHPAYRRNTQAWHGRATKTKPSPSGRRHEACAQWRWMRPRTAQPPSATPSCQASASRAWPGRALRRVTLRQEHSGARAVRPHRGTTRRWESRTACPAHIKSLAGPRCDGTPRRPPPAPQSAPRGKRRRAGGRSQRHLAHLGREVERRADEPRLGRAVRQHVERTADAEVRELDHAIPASPRAA